MKIQPKILYILSTYNLFGGTPKKTLDLMKYFGGNSSVYIYEGGFSEFKDDFINSGGKVYEGFFKRNIYYHVKEILKIIDNEGINVIHTQFTMGEFLGYLVKRQRPNVKFIVAFQSALRPSIFKYYFTKLLYKKVDSFVFISQFVKKERIKQFPLLKRKDCVVIYNGSKIRLDIGTETIKMNKNSVLAISGLIELKNINILIEAFNIIVNEQNRNDVTFYVAGDGPQKNELLNQIKKYQLDNNIFLLGYQPNVGKLLESCDVFVHPSLNEGFGIVIVEAMLNEKPIVVADAGALPELIDHEENGLIVNPYNANDWATSILRLIDNKAFSRQISQNAKRKASSNFSYDQFVTNYKSHYNRILCK